MNTLRIAQLLALAELVSALLLPGAFLFPFTHGFRTDGWYEPIALLGSLIAVLFILVPALTLLGLLKKRLLAFWGLYLSPILSFTFGVSVVPFVAYAVPTGSARTVFVGVTNVVAIALAIWLRTRLSSSAKIAGSTYVVSR